MARRAKVLTRDQLQSRKEKAVRFTRDVVGDPERADEIADESLDRYAERRKIQLQNSGRRQNMARKSIDDYREENKDLKQQIRELEDEKEALSDKLDTIAAALEPDEDDDSEDTDDDDQD